VPLILLSFIVLAAGVFFFRWSLKNKSHEMKDGSLALLLAGLFLLLWGLALIFTGSFGFTL
jgi:uncharacterized membrane protein YjjP (DUF1212 family)